MLTINSYVGKLLLLLHWNWIVLQFVNSQLTSQRQCSPRRTQRELSRQCWAMGNADQSAHLQRQCSPRSTQRNLSRQWAMLISQLTCKGSAHHEVHSETYQGNGQCWAMLDMGNAAWVQPAHFTKAVLTTSTQRDLSRQCWAMGNADQSAHLRRQCSPRSTQRNVSRQGQCPASKLGFPLICKWQDTWWHHMFGWWIWVIDYHF